MQFRLNQPDLLKKSVANKEKHGVDFVDIQKLWEDPRHLVVPARSTTEERYAAIGKIFGKTWVCIFTPRDRRFDDGEDISPYFDWGKATRPRLEQRRVNVDLPAWMIDSLDLEAKRVGVTRQSIVKVWLSERIKAESGPHD